MNISEIHAANIKSIQESAKAEKKAEKKTAAATDKPKK